MNSFFMTELQKDFYNDLVGGVVRNLEKILPVTAAVKSDPQESNPYCWSGKDSMALGTKELYKTNETNPKW